jgi:hypothetical protein
MDNIIVDDEIGKVFLYIAGFGFSDLFITYFKVNSNLAKIIYFSTMLLISFLFVIL